METNKKNFSIKEAASMLGLSVITLRRRIQQGKIEASLNSNKEGYRISEDALRKYAESQEPHIGSIWKGAAIGAAINAAISSKNNTSNLLSGALIGGILGKVIDNILGEHTSSNIEATDNLQELNDPKIIEKIIERLHAEISDLDIQIQYQDFRLQNSALDYEKNDIQENLFQLKSQKSKIFKDIKDLEIRKAIIESNQKL